MPSITHILLVFWCNSLRCRQRSFFCDKSERFCYGISCLSLVFLPVHIAEQIIVSAFVKGSVLLYSLRHQKGQLFLTCYMAAMISRQIIHVFCRKLYHQVEQRMDEAENIKAQTGEAVMEKMNKEGYSENLVKNLNNQSHAPYEVHSPSRSGGK